MAAGASEPGSEARVRLTVAVTNYNGRQMLEAMLTSLAAQTYREFSTVVVDDCSSDDSVAYVTERWPQVELLELPANSGVSAAMNTAVAAPRTELVALFNNDMELEPDCLAELVAALDRHPEAGSATPKMLDFRDRGVIDGAGDQLSWRGGGRRRGHGDRDMGQYDHAEEVFGPCGGATLFTRRALEAVGGFDPAYHAYYEDVDWAFRAQLAGFRCRYVPTAVLYHHGSATLGRGMTDFNGYHLWRNPVWLIAKCFPGRSLLRHAPDVARGQAGNLWTALRARKLGIWTRAMRDAARGLPAALRKRRAVQRSRVIALAELEAVSRTTPS
jgi:GT2 family glycosyltransferase